ncbi:hypothetical protein Cpha266_0392 [Chlorobium phaeobacteroides DSM 266]|uniref:Uncharacterized protein n=1 Tax=Chlorobium phaeobacteroides (strain DSM 266 / SMG 266 / 2430) TaxID=290317 RepID=A1BDH4_CHLPD|nr:hypothetical protein Cpha266_0392 [Chlorobium phaeobacteroides DSM 266]
MSALLSFFPEKNYIFIITTEVLHDLWVILPGRFFPCIGPDSITDTHPQLSSFSVFMIYTEYSAVATSGFPFALVMRASSFRDFLPSDFFDTNVIITF